MMYWIKQTVLNRPLVIGGKMWGSGGAEKALYNSMINSFRSLCLWTANFTSASQSLSALGGTGWLEWAEVGYFLSPGWLASEKTPNSLGSGKRVSGGQALFSRKLWHIFNWLLFPSPCWQQGGIFLHFQFENLVKLLEVNFFKVWKPHPHDRVLGIFNSPSCPHWVSRNVSVTGQVFLPQYWFL